MVLSLGRGYPRSSTSLTAPLLSSSDLLGTEQAPPPSLSASKVEEPRPGWQETRVLAHLCYPSVTIWPWESTFVLWASATSSAPKKWEELIGEDTNGRATGGGYPDSRGHVMHPGPLYPQLWGW